MSSIKKYILSQVMKQALSQEEAKKLLTELAAYQEVPATAAENASAASGSAVGSAKANAPQAVAAPPGSNEIAIIGMAGRFPMANNAEQFWQLLRNGVNCIRPLPEQRRKDFEHVLRNPSYTEFLIGMPIPDDEVPHAHASAGYLEEVDKFDCAFFGIPPAEALYMDPHQRLALELAWETMEDAGYGGRSLYGSNTGIYIGKEGTNHSLYRYTTVGNPMKLTGSWESILASRISYLFNFRGPCMVVDTACSSGLVSVHMAAQAIMNGDCDQAICGGMNASITGEFNARYQGSMTMDAVESKDGTIRTFDARANGTVWGEGVALVMLKPLARALADGDVIHAIIKGSAINNDGASNGLTAPNAEAQTQVIIKAWQKANIDPTTLSYVEAHGTGTVLGDPIEYKGLAEAFRSFTNKRQFCAIGSLKTNMGHLVGCSGVASLFKVVKSLQAREMAPTINFGKPNPYINFLNGPLYVNDSLRPWHSTGPRRAALSSFGFSHTNCHMVLEQAPVLPDLPRAKAAYCLTLTALNAGVLRDYVERLRTFCQRDDWNLADLCYTMNVGRGHYPWRVAIVASDEAQLRAALQRALLVLDGAAAADDPANVPNDALNAVPNEVRNGALNNALPNSATSGAVLYFARHEIISEKKRQVEPHEITDRQKKALSDAAASSLAQFLADGSLAQLHQMAGQYVRGADIVWQKFYQGEARRRLSLPVYPLQRIRLWPDPKISKLAAVDARLHPLVEHFVFRSAEEDRFESRFNSNSHWVLADHKIKGTCVVPGTTYLEMARVAAVQSQGWQAIELAEVFFLVPMVVAQGETRRVRLRLRKMVEQGALLFDIESCASEVDGAGQDTGNNAGNHGDNHGDNSAGANTDWLRHVEGRILPLTGTPRAPIDLAALKAKAHETIDPYQGVSDTGVFQFGQHWDATRAAWRTGDDALARLALPPALQDELAVFQLHPSVLDNAVNLTSQTTGATYLPFTYKSFKMFAGFTPEMYTLVMPKGGRAKGTALPETLSYDVLLTDKDGHVLCEVSDYVAKKVNHFGFTAPGSGADGEYLALRWVARAQSASASQPASQPASQSAAQSVSAPELRADAGSLPPGRLLLVASGDLTAQALLAQGLRAAGVAVTLLALVPESAGNDSGGAGMQETSAQLPAANLSAASLSAANLSTDPVQVQASDAALARFLASDLPQDVAGLVWLTQAEQAGSPARLASSVGEARHLGVDALFRLTQALLTAKIKLPWGLALLTQQAFQVDGQETRIDALGTASAALAAVIGMEYPNLPCRMLDVGLLANVEAGTGAGAASAAHALALHLLAAPVGRQIALRGGSVYERELFPLRLEERPAAPLRDDGVLIISGGLGGLGLACAAHLANRGRYKVLLLGRRALAERSEWATLAASEGGKYQTLCDLAAKLEWLDYQACDIGNAAQLDALLASMRQQHGAIRAIFHLAGVAGDGFLLRKTFARFDAVLKPKIDGLYNLYHASAGDDLDAFVLFSSITAITGGEGQGDYAAANAYMDGLAWQARCQGRKLVVLNWPGWKEIGMAADFAVDERHTPFLSLTPEDAFARLDRVLAHSLAHSLVQILPSNINPPALAAVRAALPFALSAELVRKLDKASREAGGAVAAKPGAAGPVQNIDDIKVQIRGKSEEELEPTEIILAKVYGVVLGLAEVDVFSNFQDMGGNSIIATHLLKVIDSQFPGLVDISDIFSYSSVDEMAAYVIEKRARLAPPAAPALAAADVATGAGAGAGTSAAASAGAASSAAAPATTTTPASAQDTELNWDEMIDQVLDDGASIDAILDKI